MYIDFDSYFINMKVSRLRLYKMRVVKYFVETKRYLRHENKVNENKVSYWKALRCETIKNNNIIVFLYVKLTNLLSF